ncbi:glycosyltransferase family 2 protein [Naasia sp. SYSU D00057]|uniref:glycosyltransferase n=1 Tax=Naasia sp. SYSU D00057 TaxID=2817380 RepID=UPI001B302ADE|nr:glycosyltransferase family 2 protein [Naasia sp. SYSU D00057]
MADAISSFIVGGGTLLLVFGALRLLLVPFAIGFEVRTRLERRRERGETVGRDVLVSVIVPAYNEEKVLENCVRSILASAHANLELVIVDDGSTDGTLACAHRLAGLDDRVTVISKANAGKGAALNTGIARSSGAVLLFADADGLFLPNTIDEMLRSLRDPLVGAVCGDDRPANLDRVQTRLLTLLSHVGTGLARRALSDLRCLIIVSGNIGAFPRHVVEEIGGFDENVVGEDLELTWRVRKAGYRVVFCPTALVFAESPSTVRALWRQRVRWARGLIQTTRLHLGMVGNPRYGAFGVYLAINTITMLFLPVVQLAVLALLPLAVGLGRPPVDADVLAVLGWLGLWVSLGMLLVAVALNSAWRDLRLIWTVVLWPAYSTFTALVVVAGLWQERNGAPAPWNKFERTGVVDASRRAVVGLREHEG